MTDCADGRVVALVLTYDAPDSVVGCLDSLRTQTRRPDEVVVTDNAGPRPVLLEAVDLAGLPEVHLQRLARNGGPAGGHAAGLRRFAAGRHEWAWIMDDDIRPEPDALEALLDAAATIGEPCVVQPTTRDAATGTLANTQGWCGVLVHRRVVEAVGLPDEALFWWTEDTEYLQWRIPRAGFPVCRSETAEVRVSRGRADAGKPAWKYYYEARNQVHYRLHVQRPGPGEPVPRHLTRRVRVWRAGRASAKLLARAVVREHDGRRAKVRAVCIGVADGVRGRLGARMAADVADRPLTRGS
jgi:rhamnopyranosyl-N-acetylglucosaminyl-diphospho-decaprenol beta-1,3/1,4-galactofuranosyltransferase